MRTKISIGQARQELSSYRRFYLNLSYPMDPVQLSGRFHSVFFNLSARPYAVFIGDDVQVYLSGIQEVWRDESDPDTYCFLCAPGFREGACQSLYRVHCGGDGVWKN